jgi:acyl carrier protein
MTVDLTSFIIGRLSEYTGIPAGEIVAMQTFEAIGLQSSDAVVLAAELEELLAKEIDVDLFLRCSTLDEALTEIAGLMQNKSGLTGRT